MTWLEPHYDSGGIVIDATWKKKPNTGVEQLSRILIKAVTSLGRTVHQVQPKVHWIYGQLVLAPVAAWRARGSVFIYPFLPPVPLVFGARASRNLVFVHDLVPIEQPETAGAYTRFIARRTLPLSLRYADAVLVATDELASKVRALTSHVLVWKPLIDNTFSLAYSANINCEYLLFIGTVEPRKNVDYLLKVADALQARGSSLRIKIAGRLGWGAKPPGHPLVDYLGYVDASEMKPLIEGALLFVTASKHEGIGLPLLEVGFAGLPAMIFRDAIPQEVLPSPALLFSGEPPIDAEAILKFASRTDHINQARQDSYANTARWNKLAARSLVDLDKLLNTFMLKVGA